MCLLVQSTLRLNCGKVDTSYIHQATDQSKSFDPSDDIRVMLVLQVVIPLLIWLHILLAFCHTAVIIMTQFARTATKEKMTWWSHEHIPGMIP